MDDDDDDGELDEDEEGYDSSDSEDEGNGRNNCFNKPTEIGQIGHYAVVIIVK